MPQNVHFHPQRPQLRAAGRASAGGRAAAESDSEDADVFEDAPRMALNLALAAEAAEAAALKARAAEDPPRT